MPIIFRQPEETLRIHCDETSDENASNKARHRLSSRQVSSRLDESFPFISSTPLGSFEGVSRTVSGGCGFVVSQVRGYGALSGNNLPADLDVCNPLTATRCWNRELFRETRCLVAAFTKPPFRERWLMREWNVRAGILCVEIGGKRNLRNEDQYTPCKKKYMSRFIQVILHLVGIRG